MKKSRDDIKKALTNASEILGISLILSEIIEQVSEAQSLIQRVESSVDAHFKSVAKEVAV